MTTIMNANESIPVPFQKRDGLEMARQYTVPELKAQLKAHKLRVSGKKAELAERLHTFLVKDKSVRKIQRLVRQYLYKTWVKLHGEALKDRSLCTNISDCLTMEDLTEIPNNRFVSFRDVDGFIYGFDILSILQLINKNVGTTTENPYNRKELQKGVITNVRRLVKLNKIMGINTYTFNEINDLTGLSEEKRFELRVIQLFQKMDELGNYTKIKWFMDLEIIMLHKLLYELREIWFYRLQLTPEIKRAICSPTGIPFTQRSFMSLGDFMILGINETRKIVLEVLENFVTKGLDDSFRNLGAFYVLGALTLVKVDASTAMPAIYASFL